jgi:hypothetical protein
VGGLALDGKTVFDLARAHVNEGLRGVNEVMQAVTKDLHEFYPDVTEREVRDLFSGYGKVRYPSKEEDLKTLREYKNLARLISAIEEAESGTAPKRTGYQRDAPTQDVREKMKQLRDTMRDMGIETTSPEQQLKTSLDAAKTRMKNAIEDLEKRIADPTAPKRERKGIEYDEEAKTLQLKVQKLREQLEAIEGKTSMTDEQRVKLATNAVRKSIQDLNRRIAKGLVDPIQGPPRPVSPEVETLRAERDALTQNLRRTSQSCTSRQDLARSLQRRAQKRRSATRRENSEQRLFEACPQHHRTRFRSRAHEDRLRADQAGLRSVMLEKDRLAQRSQGQKFLDALPKVGARRKTLQPCDARQSWLLLLSLE